VCRLSSPRPFIARSLVVGALCLVLLSACVSGRATKQGAGLTVIRNGREIPLPESPGECLRVLTYNIRVGAGPERPLTCLSHLTSSPEKLRAIADAIASVRPDLVALQEVRGSEQAAFLAQELGMNYAYTPHGGKDVDWGLALLSKVRILGVHTAPIHQGRDQRVGVLYTLDLAGAKLQFINVHYHLGGYQGQVAATVRLVQEAQEGPLILAGDLNFSRHEGALEPLLERLADTCELAPPPKAFEIERTGTAGGLFRYRLDYILVDPRLLSVIDVGLTSEPYRTASDHLGYHACVKLKHPRVTRALPQTETRPHQKAPGP